MASTRENFELLTSFHVLDRIPVQKYKSKQTGLTVCFAQVDGPLVNGFFCLATEAQDDDGLPHTLEHLVFMGSENYPYKGLLDLFANRCLAQGTNAWTDTDHTCYTMTTAGSDGFLNLLPIYLDHVLYPTLTESAYVTEVHHINGEGEDAGVVYCEMQARENSGDSRTHLEFLRDMYPGQCGYQYETGGIMENIRVSCSHQKVCLYHKDFYRADNLCLIITGQVEPEKVFSVIEPFEQKIIGKGPLPHYARPWQAPVPVLQESKENEVLFPTEDEETGMVCVGWRGPVASDFYAITGLRVLFEYLTDTAVAPLQRELVEIPDPYCSDVGYSTIENSEACMYLKVENVPFEKLPLVKEKIQDTLQNIAEGKEILDMKRLGSVIHRELLDNLNKIENHPHFLFACYTIGDFLYSHAPSEYGEKMDEVTRLKKLSDESVEFWLNLMTKYLTQASQITIIGKPSKELMDKMAEEEKKRLEEQRRVLGDTGLETKANRLQKATEENEVSPPADLVSSLPVPSVDCIQFHPLQTSNNRQAELTTLSADLQEKFPVQEIPFAFQLDHVATMFVKMTVLVDTTPVPIKLRPYLNLLLEVMFESPVMRDGVLISHEDVITQLAADTLDYGACIGVNGRRFGPGEFSELIAVNIKVELDKYEKGIVWLHEVLYKTQFTAQRLQIVANKMANDVARLKREGRKVVNAVIKDINFTSESNYNTSNMVRQQVFLTQMMKQLETTPDEVINHMNMLRDMLTTPSNLRVQMSADVSRLEQNAVEPWKQRFLPDPSTDCQASIPCVKKPSELLVSSPPVRGKIAGIGAVESAYLVQTCPAIKDFNHADLAPLMVFMECLTALEGPMWRQIRGLGLSYHYSMYCDPCDGLLYFILYKSTLLVSAYEKAKEIVDGCLSGSTPLEPVQLESAISSVIFEIVEREKSVSNTAHQSLLAQFRQVGPGYNRKLLEQVAKVTLDDVRKAGQTYVAPLFNTAVSHCSICCHPSKVEEVKEGFQKLNRDLAVVSSLDDEFKV